MSNRVYFIICYYYRLDQIQSAIRSKINFYPMQLVIQRPYSAHTYLIYSLLESQSSLKAETNQNSCNLDRLYFIHILLCISQCLKFGKKRTSYVDASFSFAIFFFFCSYVKKELRNDLGSNVYTYMSSDIPNASHALRKKR